MTDSARARLWLLGILAVACALRLPALESAPPPLNQDEASRLYDAWCLLETGADRHGRRLPLFLESFGEGDWTGALTTYLTVPFVAALGPRPLAVRLPDAIFGILTVALVFDLLRRRLNLACAAAGASILALDPWHVGLCRTGHESGFAPFFMAAAMAAMLRSGLLPEAHETSAGHKKLVNESAFHPSYRPGWAIVAGLMLGLHAWVYPATRLFTPLFLVALVVLYALQWRAEKGARRQARHRVLVAAGAGLLIGAAPIWITAISDPTHVAARARVTLIAEEGMTVGRFIITFAANYATNLSPVHLFLHFDELSGTVVEEVGLHLWATAPLFCIGVVVIATGARRSFWYRLLAAWFILYPVPAALCRDWNPHSLRTVAGMVLYPIIAAEGWNWLSARLRGRYSGASHRRVAVAAVLLLAANGVYFADVYFRRLPPHLEMGYQTALVRAMEFIRPRHEQADFVLVTRWVNQPYIYALLQAPIEPADLPETPVLAGPDLWGFHQVNRVGKFFFPPRAADETPEITAAFRRSFNRLPPDAEGLVIELEGRFGGGRVLAAFSTGPDPAGGPAAAEAIPKLEVRWWRRSEDPSP